MASSFPYMPLYVDDWLDDEALSMCEPATRGIWVDLIARMWKRDRSGELCGTLEQLAVLGRCTPAQMRVAVAELEREEAADVLVEHNGHEDIYVVRNRRMYRLALRRGQTAKRVADYRERRKNGVKTEQKRSNSGASVTLSDKQVSVVDNDPPHQDLGELANEELEACNAYGNSEVTKQSPESRVQIESSVNTDTRDFARDVCGIDDDEDFKVLERLAGDKARLQPCLEAGQAFYLARGKSVDNWPGLVRRLLANGIDPLPDNALTVERWKRKKHDAKERAERLQHEAEERQRREAEEQRKRAEDFERTRPEREAAEARRKDEAERARQDRVAKQRERALPVAEAFMRRPGDQRAAILSRTQDFPLLQTLTQQEREELVRRIADDVDPVPWHWSQYADPDFALSLVAVAESVTVMAEREKARRAGS